MSDPFLKNSNNDSLVNEHELMSLRKENKILREKLVTMETLASSPTATAAPSISEAPSNTQTQKRQAQPTVKAAENSAAIKKLKEELKAETQAKEALAKRAASLQEKLGSFVLEVCERERGYNLVFSRLKSELQESNNLCESLRNQVHDMRENAQQQIQSPSSPTKQAVGIAAPDLPGADAAASWLEGSIQSLTSIYQQLTGGTALAVPNAPLVSQPSRRRGGAASTRGGGNFAVPAAIAARVPSANALSPTESFVTTQQAAQPVAPVLMLVPGAGALRGITSPPAPTPKPRQRRVGGAAQASQSELTAPRKRRRAGSSHGTSIAGDAASLFSNFAANAEGHSARATGLETLQTSICFSDDPVGDFVLLMADTKVSTQQVLLRQKFFQHCRNDTAVLGAHTLNHLKRISTSTPAADQMDSVWKCVESMMSIDRSVFKALCDAVAPALVVATGPDRVSLDLAAKEAPILATALRIAAVLLHKRHGQSGSHYLQDIFHDISLSAMSCWRAGMQSSPQGDNADGVGEGAENAISPFEPFLTASQIICGYDQGTQHLLREHGCEGTSHDDTSLLPRTLLSYTVQAVLPIALCSDAAAYSRWSQFCDAMGWSYGQVPIQQIGEAAVRRVLESPSDDHALLALRFLVLLRGPPHLYTVMSALGLQEMADESRSATFSAFVRLIGCAVVDLRLRDDRDEQVERMIGFLLEYLENSMESSYCSCTEVLRSATEAHVLAARAIVELYQGTADEQHVDVGSTARGKYLRGALRWLQLQQAARLQVGPSVSGQHPLFDSSLGRRLLQALPPIISE